MNFSNILNNLIQERNITAYKLAQAIGVSQSIISHWKNGTKIPSAQSLQKLADYFDVSVDYLLTGESAEKTAPTPKGDEEAEENAELDRQLEGVRFALSSKDPNSTGDLTIGEKRDVVKFINFLRSQRLMDDPKDNDKKQKEGGGGDKP